MGFLEQRRGHRFAGALPLGLEGLAARIPDSTGEVSKGRKYFECTACLWPVNGLDLSAPPGVSGSEAELLEGDQVTTRLVR